MKCGEEKRSHCRMVDNGDVDISRGEIFFFCLHNPFISIYGLVLPHGSMPRNHGVNTLIGFRMQIKPIPVVDGSGRQQLYIYNC